jgi:hypothetical protein
MMDVFFHFEIYLNDTDIPGEVKHEHGIATAHTFTEAMEKVVDWYGDDNIINVYIEFCNDGGPLIFNEGDEEHLHWVMEAF